MKPKIMLLANSTVGLRIAKYLIRRKQNIVALGIHPPSKQVLTGEIIRTVNVPGNLILEAPQLRDPKVISCIKELKPDLIIAAFWGYILKKEFLSIPPLGCINFHPGYLPYNRGMNPNVWPIVEETPAGVTLHFINEGVDNGPIIARKKIKVEPIDTGGSLYEKTLDEIVELFKKTYPLFLKGKIRPFAQDEKKSTHHFARDVDTLDRIDLNKNYKARDLINILRARTYADRTYAYFEEGGRKIGISVKLVYRK